MLGRECELSHGKSTLGSGNTQIPRHAIDSAGVSQWKERSEKQAANTHIMGEIVLPKAGIPAV